MVLAALLTRDFDWQLPPLPENAPAHARELSDKGIAALREGHYEEALAHFITLGTLTDVEGALYLSKLGMHLVWRRQGDLSKALKVLTEDFELGGDRFVLLCIGVTLHQMERHSEALDTFDKVKEKWPDDPDVWVYRMAPLMSLERGQAALESAERAFPLRHKSSDRGRLLYQGTVDVTTAMGLDSLKRRWLPDLEKATNAFIKWRDRARRDKQTAAFKQAGVEIIKKLAEEDLPAFKDFMLGVRLASVKDPFDRWDAIAEEINKVWPKDLDAVEAIRRQRD